jgi:MFS family permease
MDDASGRRRWWRLAGMMGLIYGVQGSWWPMLAVHLQDLGLDGRARGWIFATLALSAIATPLGAGQVADRYLPTQRLLALIYGLGTAVLAVLAVGPTTRFAPLFGLFLVYWLITATSYGLANSLSFRNLSRPREQFGGVRLFGTLGWMLAGWIVTAVMALRVGSVASPGRGAPEAFAVAAAVSALFALYCLTMLPHTPPLASGPSRVLDLRAAADLASRPGVGVFLIAAFGVSLTMPFVYQVVPPYLQSAGLPRAWVASAMTLSQVPEVLALAVLPLMLRRLGYRGTMMVGVSAWVVMYVNLASGPSLAWALAGLPLNGIAIGCFIIAGQMYLDGQAAADRRATAQAMHVMVTSGLGSLCGSVLAGELTARHGGVAGPVFLAPALIELAMLGLLAFAFRPRSAGVGVGPESALRPMSARVGGTTAPAPAEA